LASQRHPLRVFQSARFAHKRKESEMTLIRNRVATRVQTGADAGADGATNAAATPAFSAADLRDIARLASRFAALAGSDANARALAIGLRRGSAIALYGGRDDTPVCFAPATGEMGYGSVNIALMLAMHALAGVGIERPDPRQIRAALNGGPVRTRADCRGRSELLGVLKLRSEGHAWGDIAASVGAVPGTVDKTNGGAQHEPAYGHAAR
jgi:hypothetical protein